MKYRGSNTLSVWRTTKHVMWLGFSVAGAVTSFVKQLPALAPYEYGFRVILFTYCLILVSVYRGGEPGAAGLDRLYAIAIGAVLALLVNVLIFPAWAGEQLHRELVASFAAVADSLHGAINHSFSLSLSLSLSHTHTHTHTPINQSSFARLQCERRHKAHRLTNPLVDLSDCVRSYLSGDETAVDGGEPAIEKCRAILNASARIESLVRLPYARACLCIYCTPHGHTHYVALT